MAKKSLIKSLERFAKIHIGAPLGAFLLYVIWRTVRWKRNDGLHIDLSVPCIVAFWHGRQLMLAPLFRVSHLTRPLSVLISGHTDGRLIAKAIRFFGLGSIAGSSSKGGVKAMIQLIDVLKGGSCIGITPDGPRGPAFKAKEGVIKLAQVTGCPIIPVSYGVTAAWKFESWDKMILPKPFSKGVCLLGTPIRVPETLDDEGLTEQLEELERRLDELTEQADSYSYA